MGEFFELLLQLAVVIDARFGRLLLSGCFKKELVDLADRQALGQVVKGAVLLSAVMAVTIGFSANGETLDPRGAEAVRSEADLGEEEAFAIAEREGRFAGFVYPSHNYGKDKKSDRAVNKKENAQRMRKCSTASEHGRSQQF